MINGVPRILIIRLSAIGDVVRVLPALHALRDRFPHAQIDWAVEPKSLDVISGHPAIDQVLVFDRPRGNKRAAISAFRAFCKEIRQQHYDIAIDFHGLLKSGLIARATRAKERYGFARPRAQEMSWLFTNRKVPLISTRMNRIEENLELVKALDAKVHRLDVTLDVPDEVRNHVDAYFDEYFHSNKLLVAVHPPVDRPEKQWPLANFAQLCDMLLADGRFDVILTYGPGQRDIVEEVVSLARRSPVIAPETPDLKHYAWLAARADLYFGGDTGPMHIASAMGTPVVAVFGGTDPNMHGPLRQPSTVLYAGDSNPGKPIDRDRGPELMARITAEMAYDACVSLVTG